MKTKKKHNRRKQTPAHKIYLPVFTIRELKMHLQKNNSAQKNGKKNFKLLNLTF